MCVFPTPSCLPPGGSLSPSVSATPAHPVSVAFASTFLGSQDVHGLAPAVNAHLAGGGGWGENQGHSLTKRHRHWQATALPLQRGKPRLPGWQDAVQSAV